VEHRNSSQADLSYLENLNYNDFVRLREIDFVGGSYERSCLLDDHLTTEGVMVADGRSNCILFARSASEEPVIDFMRQATRASSAEKEGGIS
jgi:hypothetical protein